MENSIKYKLNEILNEINSISSNDILVNLHENKIYYSTEISIENNFEVLINSLLINILSTNESTFKDSGVQPLCIGHGVLEWDYKSNLVKTPLFLIPISYTKNKIKNNAIFQPSYESLFINPFLKDFFLKTFDITIPEIDSITNFENWITKIDFKGEIKNLNCLGNFHHHRFQIVKDLEGLIDFEYVGSNVQEILGFSDHKTNLESPLVQDNLFPADNDQLNVFENIKIENTVIQGPPGTGKSQVLSNLLGKIIYNSSNALVVSEKRVALDVLQKKLSHYHLDDFSFISTSETVSNDFILSLKKGWDRMEKKKSSKKVNIHLSENYIHSLQIQLNLLQSKELIGGVSYDEFSNISKNIDFSKAIYTSDFPSMIDYQKDKSCIEKIYDLEIDNILAYIPLEVIKNDLFETQDVKVVEWKKIIEEVSTYFEIYTVEDFHLAMKKAATCQIIENESVKHYFDILKPLSKSQKKYSQLKKKFYLIKSQIDKLHTEKLDWKIEPSENECDNLLEALQAGSFFSKRKAKKRTVQLTGSSFIEPVFAIQSRLEFIKKNKEFEKILIELSDIGIHSPVSDISFIDSFISQIDKKEWDIYSEIKPEERKKLCDYHSVLNQLNSVFKTYFNLDRDQLIIPFLLQFEEQFEKIIRLRTEIKNVNASSYRLLSKAKNSKEFEAIVFKSNWVKFESHFPEFAKFNPQQIHEKIDYIIQLQTEESQLFSEIIEENIHSKFKQYHQLLQTTGTKLSVEQKIEKQNLKKGKAILVKEFSKSRSHPSIRELLQTEASIWIRLLKPIWLSNPSEVARCFPLVENLFDFIIFDEASQIPLSNSLGSLHRGNRIVVAGDEQQMSPTSYFKAGFSESIDLLHQASYYWKNVHLKHHYRSDHPALIEFSNTYFYDNSLITYPSSNALQNPIQLHLCDKGIYEERTNVEEAQVVCKLIEENLKIKQSIGVVAFSETQLKCIWNALKPQTQQLLTEKIDSGDFYFKALENVQGDECDKLIISLGYGKNATGEFRMQFGPLNQKSGSKRLNVLLTRAKKSIDFVTSVRSSDFKISENESINLLRFFLINMEEKNKGSLENHSQETFVFPYNLTPEIQNQKSIKEASFSSIYSTLKDANELITFQRVLENRNWKINYK